MEALVDIALLAFLAATALGILFLRDLFAAAMLMGIFSLLAASIFVSLDAVDVAFTEAAVGAGVSTILILGTLALTAREQRTRISRPGLALACVVLTGAALIYGTLDLPAVGDPRAPAHNHVAPRYIEQGAAETGVPNLVTAVLASYRGYDTLGEVVVVFTAGVGVLGLLGTRGRRERRARAARAGEGEAPR